MTLTEEQRDAVAFDLEAARAGIAHYRIENPSNVDTESALKELVDQANLAEDALAEIERLRADLEQAERVIDQQAARIKSLKKEIRRLKHESKVEQEFTNSYIKRLHDAEARIKELGSSLDEAEALTKKNAELMNGYLRRIAELEDALTEERAKYNLSWKDCAYRAPDTYCEKTHNYCTSEDCPLLDEQKTEARRQLRAEGKIGPDAKPRSWQITDERIGLLEYCLETLLDAPDIEEIPGPGHSIEVLRAMLTEAE